MTTRTTALLVRLSPDERAALECVRRGEWLSRCIVVCTDMRGDDSKIVQDVADAVDALWEEWCAGGAAS